MNVQTICALPGCPKPADHHGYCTTHRRRYRPNTRRMRRERDKALRRDRYRCQDCGRKATVVHHVLPRALGGPDTAANFASLCDDCHRARHNHIPR